MEVRHELFGLICQVDTTPDFNSPPTPKNILFAVPTPPNKKYFIRRVGTDSLRTKNILFVESVPTPPNKKIFVESVLTLRIKNFLFVASRYRLDEKCVLFCGLRTKNKITRAVELGSS